ncbi:hypothetical protein GUJ93_ZPchr0012g20983 [Zizania palustris]|uniref:Cyclin n=1 Tax=Zizania palustris TaxID=103762 RepID=A0A8J6BTM3_ZIZPA|nr:hypothetical protein GUJ93_ZPchr0012g20983 [Zizania palustris]
MPTCKSNLCFHLFFFSLINHVLSSSFPSLYNHHHIVFSLSLTEVFFNSSESWQARHQEKLAKIKDLISRTAEPAAMTTGEDAAAAAVPRVVAILSSLLQRVAERNDAAAAAAAADGAGRHHAVSAFQGLTKPAISIGGYLERIFRFANCSPSCYVVAYIYLDRFLRRRPVLAVDSFNVHRLLITSVLTAVKFVDDICYNNAYFARVGGISLMEMNYLEVDFLFGIAFDLNVTPAAFASYCAVLQGEMASLEQQPPAVDLPRLHCCPSDQDDATGCHHKQQQQQQQQLAV